MCVCVCVCVCACVCVCVCVCYQGNCGGAEMEDVLGQYYRMNLGADNLDFHGSPDEARWAAWHNLETAEDKLKKAS